MPPYGPEHSLRTRCRACDSADLRRFLELGEQALANAFLKSPADVPAEKRYPLDVHLCGTCGLVQLADVIAPDTLFKHYLYVTGTSDTIAAHNDRYAATLCELLRLSAGDLVLEAASNDGSLLKRFQERGVRVLGVEPAANLARAASAGGIPTVERFFGAAAARELRTTHGGAKAVIGNNVLAHVDEPVEFLAAARHLLAPGGLVVVEVPELRQLVERLEYDTIYHEHLSYFSVSALLRVCEEAGLSIVRLDHVPVHGGSVRVYAAPRERAGHDSAVLALAERERADGLTSLARMERLARDVAESRTLLRARLEELRADGWALAGYGAPAKGNTLLQYCGIGPELLPFTVDKNPLKVGLLTPGMHLPVLPVQALAERGVERVLILAWNFAEEVVRQQARLLERGARFLVPIPRVRELAGRARPDLQPGGGA